MATILPPQRSRTETLERLDELARFLDSSLRIPGTNIRDGADPLLDLVPGAGLAVAKGLSAQFVLVARRHGAPPAMLWWVARRAGLDLALSALTFVGWFSDAFHRANLKNIGELRRHLMEDDGLRTSPSFPRQR